MIDIQPDPQNPLGGFAILSVPEAELPDAQVSIAVFDKFRGQYLGPSGFQPSRHDFGPYAVDRSGGTASVLVGSEIVNQIDEYASLTLSMGPVEADVTWPDDVIPLAGAPALGGIAVVRDEDATPAGALSGAVGAPAPAEPAPVAPAPPPPVPDPVVDPMPEPDPLPAPEPVGGDDDAAKGSSPMIWVAAGVVLLALAAGGYWMWQQSQTAPVAEQTQIVPPPEPEVAATDPCAADALRAMAAGEVLAQLRSCSDAVSADDALLIVEAAVRGGTAEASALMGKFYDGAATDRIESATGLTFGDDPARAAEYYRTAKDQGAAEAGDLLAAVCERLAEQTDTLSRGAIDDFCGE